ncbi:MAG TPA: hypothetical protein VFD53_02000 [Ilumatobacter sp.]|nr:hypothetical protein [Ilumatobacter sp.]
MTVQVDTLLDPVTGDLQDVSQFVTGIALIEQRIRLRLRRGTGEWFLDPSVGLPLIPWRERKPPNVTEMSSLVQAEIRRVPGVVATQNWTGVHDPAARRVTLSGDVIVSDGTVTTVLVTGVEGAGHNGYIFGVFFNGSNRIVGGGPARPSTGRP